MEQERKKGRKDCHRCPVKHMGTVTEKYHDKFFSG
jgi:hypothetical protein